MTPIFKKLNFKEGYNCLVINAPLSFEEELSQMEPFITVQKSADQLNRIDFAVVFVTTLAEIELYMQHIHHKLHEDFVLWFCYPKGSSKKYKCEFNRDNGWETLGKYGMEPVRQVAVDEDWSALRFRNTAFIKTLTRGFAISEEGKKRTNKA